MMVLTCSLINPKQTSAPTSSSHLAPKAHSLPPSSCSQVFRQMLLVAFALRLGPEEMDSGAKFFWLARIAAAETLLSPRLRLVGRLADCPRCHLARSLEAGCRAPAAPELSWDQYCWTSIESLVLKSLASWHQLLLSQGPECSLHSPSECCLDLELLRPEHRWKAVLVAALRTDSNFRRRVLCAGGLSIPGGHLRSLH